ncbi:MAG: glutathione S-transferase family protein, partial [Myxococcota bacterium]
MSLTLNAWQVSPYSAKVRAYLRAKKIPFRERVPSFWTLSRPIARAVGKAVMPTVVTETGEWLQDSSEIIDQLEGRYSDPPIVPETPVQALASHLLELHGDEWLPTVIMHTRWNTPENSSFAINEFARDGFPWLPLFVSRPLAGKVAQRMQSYRSRLGITENTAPGIEGFGRSLIAHLEAHLATHAFVLGGRPTLGDFSLYGPLWAHVYRDPGSRSWFDDAPQVVGWMERMHDASAHMTGTLLGNDDVPETLDPIFRTL